MIQFPFFPGLVSCALEQIEVGVDQITLHARTTASSVACPCCSQLTSRIHSRYTRHLQDLPCGGLPVHLVLQVRRFFCLNSACPRRIFVERLEGIATEHAQQTTRVNALLRTLALALGGEPATRLIGALGLSSSADTFLRRLREARGSAQPTPRVLGLDEWAHRKGRTYGTILVDLERHAVVDLLPDRQAETVEAWLKAHPGVQIICRDRSGPLAEGASKGAPGAVQVADRFHLVLNWQQMLVRLCERHRDLLYRVEVVAAREAAALPLPPVVLRARRVNVALQQQRRAARLALYQQVRALSATGMGKAEIARRLGIGRGTVYRFARAEVFPELSQPRPQPSIIDPYVPYLRRRWQEGCHSGLQLWREIVAQGYPGTNRLVSLLVTYWRKRGQQEVQLRAAEPHEEQHQLTPRQGAWLLLGTAKPQSLQDLETVRQLMQRHEDFPQVVSLSKEFLKMVRERRGEQDLDAWLKQALHSPIGEVKNFAQALKRDLQAVRAGLSLLWSNGQTEGQVNRLKLIKRQMYGRASVEVLRQRLLLAT
jgi:transposase